MLLRTVGCLPGFAVNHLAEKASVVARGNASIRRRIAVVFCAAALLTAGVVAGLLAQLRADEITEASRLLRAVAQLTDEQTSQTLQSVERAVESVDAILSAAALSSAFPSLVTGGVSVSADSIDGEIRKVAAGRPYLIAIWVLDERGRAVYGSDTTFAGVDLSDRAYFTERRDNLKTEFEFGIPIRNRVGGKWIITASRTVRSVNGDFAGVIVAAVNPLFFDRVWTLDKEIPNLSVTLFRADGIMLMRSPVNERLIGTSYSSAYVFQRVAAGVPTGTFQNKSSVDGEMRLFAYRQLVAYPGMVLVIGQGMDQVLEPWWHTVKIIVSGWVVALIAMGALTMWVAREWKKRRNSQELYRTLFDASPHPTAALDRATRHFLAVSDAAVEHYGWSRQELLTMSSDDLYPPEDLAKVRAMRLNDVPGAIADLRGLRHHKKDGTIIDVSMILRPVDLDGRPGYLATATDITAQLRSEKARQDADAAREVSEKARSAAEEQLRQSQKMEAVGQLTGGIAHDFNNILFVILANTDALLEEEDFRPEVADRLGQIDKAVQRAADLTHQLLAFSRKQPLNPKRTDLNDLVTQTGKLLHRALGAQIEIKSALGDSLWTVNIDRTQLETALVNLCVNARDAMPGGGKLLIETANVSLNRSNITQAVDVAPGDYVMLCVTDTGSGMPPETVAKVFEPFFTTKAVGKGTGLGLSMVYGFIKQSKGHITIHSEVGRGTTFRLYLPRSDGVQEEAWVRPSAPMPRGTERILVVEDEPLVRASVVGQLQSLGYAVAQAPDGHTAIASCEATRLPYDLLLTDVVMPGPLSGRALADIVSRRWPKTKILFVSGYAENAVLHDGRADDGGLLLSKPFRKGDLAKFVRHALDGVHGAPRPLPKAA
jgi:PAS domain S-box-containing protein